jgi:HD superfamily phosphohydrolase
MTVSRSVIITDPVHQVMSFGTDDRLRKVLKAVIDTATFQRLRRISQLGLAQNVFPGATHTRFAHGLGAAFLALKALAHLEERHHYKSIGDARLEVIAAALLHDVGHGPFSHSFEQLLKGLDVGARVPMHEDWTRAAIELEESDIRNALEENGLDIAKVATAFRKTPDEGPLPKYLRQLVSSQIDVDRMDYLVRDSHFAGVALGRVDIYYLINCLTIVEHDDRGLCSLGIEEKGVKAYEGFALARQLMNRTVYYHRAVKVFEFMMEALLRQVVRDFESLDANSEVRQALPKYLRAVAAAIRGTALSSEDQFVSENWQSYVRLTEADIWYLVTTVAGASAAGVPKRIRMLAQMLLKREKLRYWVVLPGMVEVLKEKLRGDGFKEAEDCAVIDLMTTVYRQEKDQVFVMLRGGEVEEIPASSELLTVLRDRIERTSLLVVLEPEKASAIYQSGTRVQALPIEAQ